MPILFDDDDGTDTDRPERPDRDPGPAGSASSTHLRTAGPWVTHFDGAVSTTPESVHRPRPSTAPVQIAVFLLVGAWLLPWAVAALPLLVVALFGWLVLRRWGLFRGGLRLPRPGRRAADDPGLQVVTFRIEIPADPPGTGVDAEPDFRLVLRAGAGSAPIQLGDRVSGRGHRATGGIIEVSRLQVGERTTLRAVLLRTAVPVLVAAALILICAGVVGYANWDRIPEISIGMLVGPLVSLLVPVLVIYVIFRRVILRR